MKSKKSGEQRVPLKYRMNVSLAHSCAGRETNPNQTFWDYAMEELDKDTEDLVSEIRANGSIGTEYE